MYLKNICRLFCNGMDGDEFRWRITPVFYLAVIFFIGMVFFVDVFQIETLYASPPEALSFGKNVSLEDSPELEGFLIKTPGCRIPYMSPLDESVKKFIFKPSGFSCNSGIPALFESDSTSIYLVNSSLVFYNLSSSNEMHCCYTPGRRVDSKADENDNKFQFDKLCFTFSETAVIAEEFIKVSCQVNSTVIYKDFFTFVPVKVNIPEVPFEKKPLNVLVVGLDAVSRLNLHRQMPQTVSYLQKIGAIELLGYNKVGDNTFPNLIPVLTGKHEKELAEDCWSNSGKFDNCTFLWNNFKENGYSTGFGEDSSWMGIFNYQRKGFIKQPTDYAYGYFNRIMENQIGNSHEMNVYNCVGARPVYKDFLNYIYKFVTSLNSRDIPYFGFFWGASLSHDYLNKPKIGDTTYHEFFENMKDNGFLDNTALIFLSDHGIRWGEIRQTYQGRMEERLPFVFLILPKWFKKSYPDALRNLETNIKRLTTPFDLHETVLDFLNPSNLTLENLRQRQANRGQSLFTAISKERTCEMAGINSHWCTCQQSLEVQKNSSEVVTASTFIVQYMNKQLEGYAQCDELKLNEILDARLMSHGNNILIGDNNSKDYMITLKTIPGEGVFEATIRMQGDSKKYEILGTISRLNLYGKQSLCITDFHLKLYCYCKTLF